jgi:hypothetical protein
MEYLIYNFTGLTCCDGTTKAIDLYSVIKNSSDLFLDGHSTPIDPQYETPWYAINTLKLYEDNKFCLNADYYEMESIQKSIEKGLIIIPFSRTFFIMDLIPYYEQGLKIVFMKIKDYKQFKKDYENSIITVEDKSNRELF